MNGVTTPTLTRVDQWHELYKAALFETDKQKIPARIADAEQAIVLRARELFFSSTEEDQALDDALYALRALNSLGLFHILHSFCTTSRAAVTPNIESRPSGKSCNRLPLGMALRAPLPVRASPIWTESYRVRCE